MAKSYASMVSNSGEKNGFNRVNLGIFDKKNLTDNSTMICRYGDLNCSVEEFLLALEKKGLLCYVWGITRHYSNRCFEFVINTTTKTKLFLESEIDVKGVTLRIQQKYVRKVHILVQNIPLAMLVSGCSGAIMTLGKHLAVGRGTYESFYCQKGKVGEEEIYSGNVIIILSGWQDPSVNPLPRYQNVDGLTLRYKHNGQPQLKPLSEKKTEMQTTEATKATKQTEPNTLEAEVDMVVAIQNTEEKVITKVSNRKRTSKNLNKISKSKKIISETETEEACGKQMKETEETSEMFFLENICTEDNCDLNFADEDCDLLKCAERKS